MMYNQSHNLSGVLERSGVGVRSTLDHVLYILYMFDPTIRHVRIRHTWRMLAGMFFLGMEKVSHPDDFLFIIKSLEPRRTFKTQFEPSRDPKKNIKQLTHPQETHPWNQQ